MNINEKVVERNSQRIQELLERDPSTFGKQEFTEAIQLFGGVFDQFDTASGLSGTWQSNGAYWNSINSAGSAGGAYWTAFYWLSTFWFNKMQRYLGRWLYYSNAYAATAVDKMSILVMGSGFEYTSDNKSMQKRIDEWVERNDYQMRSIEDWKRRQIDGETFLRVFNEDTVRFVDPDLIYTSNSSNGKDLYSGIILDPQDNETVDYYEVHEGVSTSAFERVPPTEMQQRANKHFAQTRGFSRLLPVATDIFLADELTIALATTAKARAKIAAIRQHKSNAAATETFLANIQGQPQNQFNNLPNNANGSPLFQGENIERYPAGSVVDTDVNTTWDMPPGIEADGYVALLSASLRKIAAHFHLPMAVYAQDQNERGAFAAEMVSNSYLVRSIEALQHEQKRWDMQLLKMCGFDITQISIQCPEVSVVDKKAAIEEAMFLLQQGLVSRHTLCKTFNLDYEKELELIKKEMPEVEEIQATGLNNNDEQSNRSDGTGRSGDRELDA